MVEKKCFAMFCQNCQFFGCTPRLKPTDAITTENRQELYEMLFFCQRLHISGSVKWPLSYKHNLLDMELFPWEYPINYTLKN